MARHIHRTWLPTMVKPKPALPDDREKRTIVTACETFLRDVLKPRFLPEIRPSAFNSVIDLRGAQSIGPRG